MNHTQLRSFHAVAAEGGFTAASRVLGVGQPTITSQVRALEEHFGVELFHRRGRRVELTDTGRILHALTTRIMSLEAEVEEMLNASGGFHIGHLKVGAVGPYHVTEMLAAFTARYPGLGLSVTVGNSQDVLNKLLAFEVDVAVLAHTAHDPRLYTVPYSRHPVLAFVNRDHPWAGRRSVRIEELADQPLIVREPGSTTRRALETALGNAGVTVNPVMEIGSREAVWAAVERGIGIGVVSDIEFVPHSNLHTLRISNADVHTVAHVVCLAERRGSRMVQAFLDVVGGLLAGEGKRSLRRRG